MFIYIYHIPPEGCIFFQIHEPFSYKSENIYFWFYPAQINKNVFFNNLFISLYVCIYVCICIYIYIYIYIPLKNLTKVSWGCRIN